MAIFQIYCFIKQCYTWKGMAFPIAQIKRENHLESQASVDYREILFKTKTNKQKTRMDWKDGLAGEAFTVPV